MAKRHGLVLNTQIIYYIGFTENSLMSISFGRDHNNALDYLS